MAWLWAEQAAEELILHVTGPTSPALFEFRATRDVLTLTLVLTGLAAACPALSTNHLQLIHAQLSDGRQWLQWCRHRLDRTDTFHTTADRTLARNAWRWLTRNHLLATQEPAAGRCDVHPAPAAKPAAHGGVAQAHRILTILLT